MASLVLGAAGAAIGSLGGPIGAQIGWMIGSMIGNLIDPPKGPTTTGPRITDLKAQTSDYGTILPVTYGTVRIAGNVIWATPIKETKHTESAGKGGPQSTSITYTYAQSFAVGLAEGDCKGIRRIWSNGDLIYSAADTATGGTINDSKQNLGTWRFYEGSETQGLDPTIVADQGEWAVPFLGVCYVVFENLQLANYGNRTPQLEFELVKDGSILGFRGLGFAQEQPDQYTTNPLFDINSDFYDFGNDSWLGLIAPRLISMNNGYARIVTPTISSSSDNSVIFDPRKAWDFSIDQVSQSTLPTMIQLSQSDDDRLSPYQRVVKTIDGIGYSRVPIGTLAGTYVDLFIPTLLIFPLDFKFSNRGVLMNGGSYFTQSGANQTEVYHDGTVDLFNLIPDQNKYMYGIIPSTDGNSIIILAGDNPLQIKYPLSNPLNPCTKWYQISVVGYVPQLIDSGAFAQPYDALIDLGFISTALFWFRDTTQTPATQYFDIGSCSCVEPTGSIYTATQNPNSVKYYEIEEGVFTLVNGVGSYGGSSIIASNGMIQSIHSQTQYKSSVDPTFGYFGTNFTLATKNEVLTNERVNLADIVSDQLARIGFTPDQYDVTNLQNDSVAGFVLATRPDTRTAIQTIASPYFFDAVESDGLIKFVKRGNGPSFTITPDFMGATDSYYDGSEEPLQIVRNQELALPKEISVIYMDATADYRTAVQYARRQVTEAVNTTSIQVPIVMTADEAQTMVNKTLYTAWNERETFTLNTSRYFTYLEPTDVVNVQSPAGNLWTVRLTNRSDGANGVIQWQATREDPALYGLNNYGVQPPPTSGDQVQTSSPSFQVVFNGPALTDGLNSPGFFIAATGYTSVWDGCISQRSYDGGATWSQIDASLIVDADQSTVGFVKNILGPWNGANTLDPINYIDIQIIGNGEIYETSFANMIANQNAIWVGGEVVQFMNIEQLNNNTLRLSNLFRGVRGTDYYINRHVANEEFVLLDYKKTKFIGEQLTNIGVQQRIKAINIDTNTPSNVSSSGFVFDASTLKPLPPGTAFMIPQLDGTIIFNWVRRERIYQEWLDFVDVPQSEALDEYSIDISNVSDFSTVKTYSISNAYTFTYTSTQRNTDWGTTSGPIFARIYKLSGAIGRGYPAIFRTT